MSEIVAKQFAGRAGVPAQQSMEYGPNPPLFRAGDQPAISDFVIPVPAGALSLLFGAVVGVNSATGMMALATNGGIGRRARAKLTLSGNAVADETVTVGTRVYTFKATPNADDQVDVGTSAAISAANLAAAINGSGGDGYFAGTAPHEVVEASVEGDTVNLTAKWAGSDANSLASAETMTNGAFAATTFGGGEGGVVPFGVLNQDIEQSAAAPASRTSVYVSGVFNQEAMTWDASFTTDLQKRYAFNKGQPSFVNILIRKAPFAKDFGTTV